MQFQEKEIQKFTNLELLARQAVEGFITGLHKSPYHGFSVEFAEHRLYNKGESTRHIDWKLYARSDKMFVKRYEEETNLRCRIILDVSPSMFFPVDAKRTVQDNSKLSFSVFSAAALINLLKRQRDAVGLSFADEQVVLHTEAKSTTQHQMRMYAELGKQLDRKVPEQGSKSNLVKTLHEIAERIHRRSLVVIFSDMIDNADNTVEEVFAALQHLKHNKHEVILFHVLDKKTEVDFQFENKPYRFVDMETGEEVKMNPREYQKELAQQLSQRLHDLKVKCGHYKIDIIEVDIEKPFDDILLPFLIKRQKLN
ncbi:MAG: DUF58 domain-containing protein [Schleiferiaceae bacterium]|jgi:uncharacterized protein (DUF58 family)|nr:DUF58 domain-containing protein [Schleiferiaceae bacterium]